MANEFTTDKNGTTKTTKNKIEDERISQLKMNARVDIFF